MLHSYYRKWWGLSFLPLASVGGKLQQESLDSDRQTRPLLNRITVCQSFLLLFFVVIINSCAPSQDGDRSPFDPYGKTVIQDQGMQAVDQGGQPTAQKTTANGSVALLLPLSGPQAAVGQSMLNAAQLALFDINDPTFELIPIDTKGTAFGAREAVREAASRHVKLILGPLLSDAVAAAGQSARGYGLNIVGFTTDSRRAGGNVMTLGILPYDQGKRLADYAAAKNLRRVALIAPQDAYGQAVISAFKGKAITNGLTIVHEVALNPSDNTDILAQRLSEKKGRFDAIVMPVGNPVQARLAQSLTSQGMGASTVTWLGAGLWDDPAIQSNRLMTNAVYAAPPPQLRRNFEMQYQTVYGDNPQRLASLAYDATALAVVLLRQNGTGPVRSASLMNPNGFAGIDGIFRFQGNGLAERGLAMHRIIGPARTAIIDQAPNSFVQAGIRQ